MNKNILIVLQTKNDIIENIKNDLIHNTIFSFLVFIFICINPILFYQQI